MFLKVMVPTSTKLVLQPFKIRIKISFLLKFYSNESKSIISTHILPISKVHKFQTCLKPQRFVEIHPISINFNPKLPKLQAETKAKRALITQ